MEFPEKMMSIKKSEIRTIGDIDSDHMALLFDCQLSKPQKQKKTINYRKWKSLNIDVFNTELQQQIQTIMSESDTNVLVEKYNNILNKLLDKHIPQQTRDILDHNTCPFYNTDLRNGKRLRRKLERKWKKSGNEIDLQIYKSQCQLLNNEMKSARETYYTSKINECGTNQKALFNILNELMHRKKASPLPDHDDPQKLAEQFCSYFTDKIKTIYNDFENHSNTPPYVLKKTDNQKTKLENFKKLNLNMTENIVKTISNKSCKLDPMPFWLIKSCFNSTIHIISKIINTSFNEGIFPNALKEAIINVHLKHPNKDKNNLANYRPVSNIPILSKMLEKAAAIQLITHLKNVGLFDNHQSAYKQLHSVETALLCVQNDIITSLDNKMSVILVMLDLSAAFDTINHKKLMVLLDQRVGLKGNVLKWFSSYLSSHTFSVHINGMASDTRELVHGVPQGSILGPLLFNAYMLPLHEIMKNFQTKFHCYADDTQIYISFEQHNMNTSVETLERCVSAIATWMDQNMLKLNGNKTQILILPANKRNDFNSLTLNIAEEKIKGLSSANNLGVIFDRTLSMEHHINNICKTCYLHLHNIASIRRVLPIETCKTLIHAFVTSHLDRNNSLLTGINKTLIKKLQRIQNTAARIITRSKKYDHITPVLKELHWLPIEQRIKFKIIDMTFKCVHSLAPVYLSSKLNNYYQTRNLRSTKQHLLNIPKTNTTQGKRAFSIIAPILWNKLPNELRQLESHELFKKRLKTELFREAFCL